MSRYDLVKVDNDIQSLNISKLDKNEMKIFIKLLKVVANKMDQKLEIQFNEFRKVLNGSNYSNKDIGNFIESMASKVFASYIKIRTINKVVLFSLFEEFEIDFLNQNLIVKVNQKFLYFINNLMQEYSIFNLSEVLSFKSKFSILIYKKIREFYGQKEFSFLMDELVDYFDIKNKNPIQFWNLKIEPIIKKELKQIFPNFKIEKLKFKTKSIKEIVLKW